MTKKVLAIILSLTMILPLFSGFENLTLAAGGAYEQEVGKTVSLTGTTGNNHSWSSSDTKIATVSGTTANATVTGIAPGKVTITHSYRSGGNKSETFTVVFYKEAHDPESPYEVAYDGTMTITGTAGVSGTDKWTITTEDGKTTDLAALDTEKTKDNVAVINPAKKEGTVKITHSFKLINGGADHTETFLVHFGPPVDKTVHWTTEGKTAEIVIQSIQTKEATGTIPKVLFLGSLCNSHGLTSDNIKTAINGLSAVADVDYYLYGLPYDNLTNNNAPTTGQLKRGQSLTTVPSFVSKGHISHFYFAEIISGLDISQYDLVVFEFDAVRMAFFDGKTRDAVASAMKTHYNNTSYSKHKGQNLTYDDLVADLAAAAYKLVDMYADNRVAWLIPKKDQGGQTTGYRYLYDDKSFGAAAGSSTAVDNTGLLAWDALALMAPETWLAKNSDGEYIQEKGTQPTTQDGVEKAIFADGTLYRERAANTFTADNPKALWAEYGNQTVIAAMAEAKARQIASYHDINISDIVSPGFSIIDGGIKGQYLDETGAEPTWKDAPAGTFTYEIVGNSVNAEFNLYELGCEKTRLIIGIETTEEIQYEGEEGERVFGTNVGNVKVSFDDGTTQERPSPVLPEPGIDITKIAIPASGSDVYVGSEISYYFKVTNIGEATVKEATITDELLGFEETITKDIEQGKTLVVVDPDMDYEALENEIVVEKDISTYVVKETDFTEPKLDKDNNKVLVNHAQVEAVPADAMLTEHIFDTGDATHYVKGSTVEVNKTSDYTGKTSGQKVKAGDEITYTVTVKNPTPVALSGITVKDKLDGVYAVNGTGYTVDSADASLVTLDSIASGATTTITYKYTVTEADILAFANDGDKIKNEVEVTGTNDVTGTTSCEDEPVAPVTTLQVTKTSSAAKAVKAGDTVTYTVNVKNTGNVTLENVKVTDSISTALLQVPTGQNPAYTRFAQGSEAALIASIAPGASVDVTYKYTVLETDYNAATKKLVNVAYAEAENPVDGGDPVKANNNVSNETLSYTVVKVSNKKDTEVDLGDKIKYTVTVTNTGSATLNNIVLVDNLPGIEAVKSSLYTVDSSNPAKVTVASLASGANIAVDYTYTVKESDLTGDNDSIENVVDVTAKGPDNEDALPGQATNSDVPLKDANPAITVEKSSNKQNEEKGAFTLKEGEDVIYTVTITNSGNITVKNIVVEDSISGALLDTTKTGYTKVDGTQKALISELAPKAKVVVYYNYKVTAADVTAGKVTNTASATGKDHKGEDVKGSDKTENPVAGFTVVKTSDFDSKKADLGDTVTYSVTVKNTGSTKLTNLVITDALSGAEAVAASQGEYNVDPEDARIVTAPALAKGTSLVIKYTYTITEADILAGEAIKNKVTVTAKDPDGDEVGPKDASDENVIPEEANPELTVTKTPDKLDAEGAPAIVEPGDSIKYTVNVKNTGNITVNDIVVEDSFDGAKLNTPGTGYSQISDEEWAKIQTLKPGESVDVLFDYTVDTADVTAEGLVNTAIIAGIAADDSHIDREAKCTNPVAAFTAEKTSESDGQEVALGETVIYDVKITNTGSAALTDVTVSDPGTEGVTGSADYEVQNDKTVAILTEALEPGDSVTVQFAYTVTEADILALAADETYTIKNKATVTASDPDGNELDAEVEAEDNTVLPEAPKAEITATKTSDKVSGETALPVQIGDELTYTVTVTNTGNVTVENITVADGFTTATLVESSDGSYTKAADGSETAVIESLEPEASVSVQFSYTVVEDDIDSTGLKNTAAVSGTGSEGTPVSDEPSCTNPYEDFTVTKTSNFDDGTPATPDDTVNYTVTVENTGTVDLVNVVVMESLDGVTAVESKDYETFTDAPEKAVIASLPAGESVEVVYAYVITEDDIRAEETIKNKVTVTAEDPDGRNVGPKDAEDNLVTPVEPNVDYTITKTVDKDGEALQENEKATYTVTVENKGNISLNNVTVSDLLADIELKAAQDGEYVKIEDTEDASITKIAPGEKVEVKFEYVVKTITAEDLKNTAKVTSDEDEAGKEASVTNGLAGYTVKKTSDFDETPAKLDDVVTYKVTVENTGSVKLTNIVVDDERTDVTLIASTDGSYEAVAADVTKATVAELAVGGSVDVYFKYTVTEADISAGDPIENTVKVTAKDPDGDDMEVSDTDSEVLPDVPVYALTVEKTSDKADEESSETLKIGEVINYTVKVTNSGNQTMTDVLVTDALANATLAVYTDCGYEKITDTQIAKIASIEPDDTVTVRYSYIVAEEDLESGVLTNKATAEGKDGEGKDVTASDEISNDVAIFTVEKSVAAATEEPVDLGEKVTYEVTVTNTGAADLSNVVVEDKLAGIEAVTDSDYTIDPSNKAKVTVASLKAGDSVVVTYEYVVTEADLLAEEIVNTVAVNAEDPDGDALAEVTDTNDEVLLEDADAEIQVEKTSDLDGKILQVGDKIEYTVTVSNTGNLTISNIEITDEIAAAKLVTPATDYTRKDDTEIAVIDSLEPGDSVDVKYTYTVLDTDVTAADGIKNQASAAGEDPEGTPVEGEAETANEVVRLEAEKTSDYDTDGVTAALDDVVTYTVTITNTGSDTLKKVTVKETLINAAAVKNDNYDIDAADAKKVTLKDDLEPGDTATVYYTYKITEADIKAEKDIENKVQIDAEDSDGRKLETVYAEDNKVTPEEPNLDYAVTKTSDKYDTETGAKTLQKDEKITYKITVENKGNITLNNVTVADLLADITLVADASGKYVKAADGSENAVITSIAPKGIIDIFYEYVVKNISAQDLENNVKVTSDEDLTGKTAKTSNGLAGYTVDKTTTYDDGLTHPALNDIIEYTVTVANTGSTALTDIVVKDNRSDVTAKTSQTGAYDVDASDKTKVTVAKIEKGGSVDVIFEYKVTEADILAYASEDTTPIANTVTVTAKDADKDAMTVTAENKLVTPEAPNPALSVKKTSNKVAASGEAEAVVIGDSVIYTITVENTGNVTISDIVVADALENATLIASSDGSYTKANDGTENAVIASLAPGADAVEVQYAYIVAEADVTQDGLKNTATVKGNDPTDKPVEKETSTTNPVANYTVEKTSVSDTGTVELGEVVTYTVKVTNTGNVALSNIVVEDKLAGTAAKTDPAYTVDPADAKKVTVAALPVGQSVEVKYTYTVTEADILAYAKDDKKIENKVVVTADDPEGDPAGPREGDDNNVTPAAPKAELTILKISDKMAKPMTFKTVQVGETVNYSIHVSNTGNVTVTDITVVDSLADAKLQTAPECGYTKAADGTENAVIDSLEPGKSVDVKYTYVVAAKDATSEGLKNTATASGSGSDGSTPNGSSSTTNPFADYSVEKTSDFDTAGTEAKLGDIVTYTVKVKNTGTTVLTDVVVTEQLDGTEAVTDPAYTIDPADAKKVTIASLAVGATAEVKYTYEITEEDILAKEPVANKVTVSAKDPDGDTTGPKDAEDNKVTPEEPNPELTVVKTSDRDPMVKANVNDKLTYTITVSNTGNLTAKDIVVADAIADAKLVESTDGSYTKAVDGTENALISELAPGETVAVKYEYIVTEDDSSAGEVTNTVTVTAKDPEDGPINGDAETKDDVRTPFKPDDPEDEIYNGQDHKWSPVVKDNDGNILTEGVDYVLKYYDMDGNELTEEGDFTDVKRIKVVILGIGNFTGTMEKFYDIIPQGINEKDPTYEGVKADIPDNYYVDGDQHKWSPEVRDMYGNLLTEGRDYVLEYLDDNGNPITDFSKAQRVTLVIQGIGNYTSRLVRQYMIIPKLGDDTNLPMWYVLMVSSMAIIALGGVMLARDKRYR